MAKLELELKYTALFLQKEAHEARSRYLSNQWLYGTIAFYREKSVKSLLVLQNFSTAQKSGNISYILKAFFTRHSSDYETSDSDRKVVQTLYSQMRIHVASIKNKTTCSHEHQEEK